MSRLMPAPTLKVAHPRPILDSRCGSTGLLPAGNWVATPESSVTFNETCLNLFRSPLTVNRANPALP